MIGGRGSGPKNRIPRTVDQPAPITGGGGQPLSSEAAQLEAPVPIIPAPTGLTVSQKGVERAGPSPSAFFVLRWFPGPGTPAGVSYDVEYDTASDFSIAPIRKSTSSTEGTVRGAPITATIYFRVRAVVAGFEGQWSAVISDSVGSASDIPPDPVTGEGYAWSPLLGDLLLTCTPPAGERVRGVIYRIYTASGGTLLHQTDPIGGRFVWTRQMMEDDRGGLPLPASASCHVVINAVSWVGNESDDVTLSPTRPAPGTPAGFGHSWASDDGTADENLFTTWTPDPASVLYYRLTADGVAQPDVRGSSGALEYTFAQNRAEHPTILDGAALTLSLVAVDALGQTSATPATATATNVAPPASVLTAVFAGTSTVGLTITPSTARDLLDYRVRVYKSGVLVDTVYTPSDRPTVTIEDGSGSYQFDVAARDVFGQVGTASSLSGAVALIDWTTFVADLRSGLIYTDSVGTAFSTLSGLKDGNLTTNVVTYTASTPYRSTTGDWQQTITHQTSEVVITVSIQVYMATSTDGATWTFYYGGTPSGGVWAAASSTATEATAAAGAVILTPGAWRIDLPAPAQARYVRIYHRNTTLSYSFREFFPSTLIRGTYVQAESITAVQIAAGAITGDRLTATAINGFTITGATIQTSASGERVVLDATGLKIYDASGTVQIEATTATDGALTWGTGNGQADADGIRISVDNGLDDIRAYTFATSNFATDTYGLYGVSGVSPESQEVYLLAENSASKTAAVGLRASGGANSTVMLQAWTSGSASNVTLTPASGMAITGTGGLNVGSATGATTGQIKASGTATLSAGLNLGTGSGAGTGSLYLSGSIESTSFPGAVVDGVGTGPAAQSLRWRSNAVGYAANVVNSSATSFANGLFIETVAATSRLITLRRGGTDRFVVTADGNATLSGTLTESSDRRLKRNIRALEGSLAVILALAPKGYQREDGGEEEELGLIAQDAQAIDPRLVGAVGDDLGVRYRYVLMHCVRAVQELHARLPGRP